MSQAATNQKPLGKAHNSEAWRDPWSLPLESLDPAQAILKRTYTKSIFVGFVKKTQFTTPQIANLARTGRLRNTTILWRSTPIIKSFRRIKI